jgi:hypothetical protein
MTREEIDKIAWASIHARASFSGGPGGLVVTPPANYQELWDQISADVEPSRPAIY